VYVQTTVPGEGKDGFGKNEAVGGDDEEIGGPALKSFPVLWASKVKRGRDGKSCLPG
jgi:hypothetical protein